MEAPVQGHNRERGMGWDCLGDPMPTGCAALVIAQRVVQEAVGASSELTHTRSHRPTCCKLPVKPSP